MPDDKEGVATNPVANAGRGEYSKHGASLPFAARWSDIFSLAEAQNG